MKLINKLWGWIKNFLTPKMIPIIILVWLCTNGIWYIIGFAPISFVPSWLSHIAKGYIVFLWLPWSVEKPIIIAISLIIYRIIYKEKFSPVTKEQKKC